MPMPRPGMQNICAQLYGRSIALAVVDHIVSTTAVVVPVQRVAVVLRKVCCCMLFSCLRSLASSMHSLELNESWWMERMRLAALISAYPLSEWIITSAICTNVSTTFFPSCAFILSFLRLHRVAFLSDVFRDVCPRIVRAVVRLRLRRPQAHAPSHCQPLLEPGLIVVEFSTGFALASLSSRGLWVFGFSF